MRCCNCGSERNGSVGFVEYSPGNIKLKRCVDCGEVVDKYVEYEDLLIACDVLLHKSKAYYHLLYNRTVQPRHYLWGVAYNMMLEFYMRMYYIGDVNEIDTVLHAAVLAVVASFISISVALLVFASYTEEGKTKDLSKVIHAVNLGSGVKSLFVIMSIWTYPKRFLLILRILSFTCTAIALRVVLVPNQDKSGVPIWVLSFVIGSIQSAGDGGTYMFLSQQ